MKLCLADRQTHFHIMSRSSTRHFGRLLGFMAFVLVLSCNAVAQVVAKRSALEQGIRVAEAVPVEPAPRLDGTLKDPLWQSAKPITDFRQQEPYEGAPATEKSEVRILYTRHSVYFG